jgi:deoxyxylulose-5-phosphate synthase
MSSPRILPAIKGPEDLKGLTTEQLNLLASEIREFLIEKVSKTGGHLGPNLGVVELTIAMHRIFDSPRDVMLFDTGHQSYVHKILTGRQDGFDSLRQRGGLAGYPSRAESEHDVIENSHASGALSWADGVARGFCVQGVKDRNVVCVVGDGAWIWQNSTTGWYKALATAGAGGVTSLSVNGGTPQTGAVALAVPTTATSTTSSSTVTDSRGTDTARRIRRLSSHASRRKLSIRNELGLPHVVGHILALWSVNLPRLSGFL